MSIERSRPRVSPSYLLVGTLLFVLGCGDLLPQRSTGEKLYRKNCASCHGLDARGHTIRYMGIPRADLTNNDWKYSAGDSGGIQETVLQGVVERHPASLQRLEKKELKEIADWVLELRRQGS